MAVVLLIVLGGMLVSSSPYRLVSVSDDSGSNETSFNSTFLVAETLWCIPIPDSHGRYQQWFHSHSPPQVGQVYIEIHRDGLLTSMNGGPAVLRQGIDETGRRIPEFVRHVTAGFDFIPGVVFVSEDSVEARPVPCFAPLALKTGDVYTEFSLFPNGDIESMQNVWNGP